MIAHGTFVRTVVNGHLVDGIVLNSLYVGGVLTYIIGWEPQVAGQRVIAWARHAFVAEKDLAELASLIPAADVTDKAPAEPAEPAPATKRAR